MRSAGCEEVDLRDHYDVRFGGELRAVRRGLAPQQLVGRLRVGAVGGHEHGDEPGALDVLKEPQAQALPRVGALDDPGDIGDDERAMIGQPHHAEVGLERRERVVGDLGPRRRDHRQQRALAGVGLAQQTDVHGMPGLAGADG